jgi:ATP-dependent RNA helicase DeaD
MQNFLDIPELVPVLSKVGITELTPPQQLLIDSYYKLPQSNICLHANNGTGKTIGYFILGVAQLLTQPDLRILILVPTRELAFQVYNLFNIASRHCNSKAIVSKMLVGGLSLADDRASLVNVRPNVLVGTGGRVLQMFKLEAISLSDFGLIVFDEYDKLFENKEFVHILKLIKRQAPSLAAKPRFVCVSATFVAGRFRALKQSLRGIKSFSVEKTPNSNGNPNTVTSDQKMDINLSSIKQYYIEMQGETSTREQITSVIKFLCESISYRKALIFYNDKVNGDDLWQDFRDSFPDIEIIYIHGDLAQRQRFKLFNKFKHQDVRLGITTDLLARGVDFENVDLVFNFDLPHNATTYFHRIGRCGRNNNPGASFIFLTQKTKAHINESWLYKLQMDRFHIENPTDDLQDVNSHLASASPVFLKTDAVVLQDTEEIWVAPSEQVYDQAQFKYIEESDDGDGLDYEQGNGDAEVVGTRVAFDDEVFRCQHCLELMRKLRECRMLSSDICKYFSGCHES